MHARYWRVIVEHWIFIFHFVRFREPIFSQLQMRLIGAIVPLNSLNRARCLPYSKIKWHSIIHIFAPQKNWFMEPRDLFYISKISCIYLIKDYVRK